jgi:type II secretion system protein N
MQMTATTRRALLALYIVLTSLVLLYVRFPSQALSGYVAFLMNASLPGLSVAVGDVRPSLTAGIVVHGIRISREDQTLVVIDRLRIQPELLSMLGSRTGFELSGSAGGGELTGRAEIDSTGPSPKTSGNARITGVSLQDLAGLRGPYGSKLSGRLDGNFSVSGTGALSGKFTVTDWKVELAAPVFDQKDFNFRTADADFTLQNQNFQLRNCRLKGNELDAEISGTIVLGQPQGADALNLRGRLTPHPAFMSRAEASIPPNLLRRRGGVPFRVSGPLEAPGFSLN